MKLLTEMGGYEFHDWKIKALRGRDSIKLELARDLVATAISVLEGIDDEYEYPVHEVETLDDMRTELTNAANDCRRREENGYTQL